MRIQKCMCFFPYRKVHISVSFNGENLVVLCSVRRYFRMCIFGGFSPYTNCLVGLRQYSIVVSVSIRFDWTSLASLGYVAVQ